jgi:hypothetical protein
MAQIVMVVTSIDTLALYKVSDDLILDLVGVTATVDDDSEGSSQEFSIFFIRSN